MDSKRISWAKWWLRLTCSDIYINELEGDLYELYYRDLDKWSENKAKWLFLVNAIISVRLYRINKHNVKIQNLMLSNYLLITYRHSLKNKVFSAVNLLSLVLGFTACFYIALFIKNELGYDDFHQQQSDLYRVLSHNTKDNKFFSQLPSPAGKLLKEEFEGIKVSSIGNDPIKIGKENPILVNDFYWTDKDFLSMFSFTILQGSATALEEKNSLVLTESLSKKIFGDGKAIGVVIPIKIYDGDVEMLMTVRAIVADLPEHSHIQFEALGSMANAEELYSELVPYWGFNWLSTYALLSKEQVKGVEASIPDVIVSKRGEDRAHNVLAFQPLGEVHLYSKHVKGAYLGGDIVNVQLFIAIGSLILLIAVFNYINLSTARTIIRAKEVGLRKTVGATKTGIIYQFLAESFLFCFVAGVISILIVLSSLEQVNYLLNLSLSLEVVSYSEMILVILGITSIALLAGVYPALLMAKLNLKGVKGGDKQGTGKSGTRSILLLMQYVITVFLISVSLIIVKQYRFMKNHNLGFDKEQLINLPVNDRQLQEKIAGLKNQVIRLPGVLSAATTGETLPARMQNTWGLDWPGNDSKDGLGIDVVGVDEDYFKVLGVGLLLGTDFKYDYSIDSARSFIINNAAQALMELDDPIGAKVEIGGKEREIIAVVEDYYMQSLHQEITPIAYFVCPAGARVSPDNVLVRIEVGAAVPFLEEMEDLWKENSSDPFEYSFVEEDLNQLYAKEQQFSHIINIFTIIAVFVALCGLFGMISYQAKQRLKEVGIRKVLGAGQPNLIGILSLGFIRLYLISLVVAVPIAYWFGGQWLSSFPIRITLGAGVFIIAVALCFAISLIVLLSQVVSTAKVNPVDILRGE